MRYRLLASFVVVAGLAAPRAAAADTRTTPFGGANLLHRVTGSQDLWVLQVDLCTAGINVRTTGHGERGRTVSSFANLTGAAAAVNGDFFGGDFNTDGPAMHGGAGWGLGVDHTYVAPIAFGPGFVDIPHHNNEGGPAAGAVEVVSGHPTLLDDGGEVGNPGDPLCSNRHPRTAVGISQDHRTLILAVVDGRRSGAAGMTCTELANLMRENGAFDAVNMDGGGSSTMVVAGGVKNRPSDGSSRTVGNHLAILETGSADAPLCPERAPVGVIDNASCDDVNGWAIDADDLGRAIDVHFYVGGPAGSGAPGFAITADAQRDDLCGFLGCNHGFHFAIPAALRDGTAKDVFAYGIDLPGGRMGNPLLTNAPASVTCAPPVPPLSTSEGRLRHVSNLDAFNAWAFDFNDVAVLDVAVVDAFAIDEAFPLAPRLVRDAEHPHVWLVDGDTRRHVIDPASFAAWGFAGGAIEELSVEEVAAFTLGASLPARPFLLRKSGDIAVYVLDVLAPPAGEEGEEGEGEEGEGEEGEEGEESEEGEGEGEEGEGRVIDVDVESDGCAQTSSSWSSLLVSLLLLARRSRRS